MKIWRRGFSLLELLITLTIMSILTAIAVPLYSQHLAHAKRLQAEVTLLKLSSALEQYYMLNNTYADATLAKLHFPTAIADGRYHLIILENNSTRYRIAAQPLIDNTCGELILSSQGEKSVTGTGNLTECWC
jgi:type IV pilus assembly protein PilE